MLVLLFLFDHEHVFLSSFLSYKYPHCGHDYCNFARLSCYIGVDEGMIGGIGIETRR